MVKEIIVGGKRSNHKCGFIRSHLLLRVILTSENSMIALNEDDERPWVVIHLQWNIYIFHSFILYAWYDYLLALQALSTLIFLLDWNITWRFFKKKKIIPWLMKIALLRFHIHANPLTWLISWNFVLQLQQ